MIDALIQALVGFLDRAGPGGIFLAMALESACFPLPSEVVLPFAGFLVARGRMGFWEAVTWATLGQLVGSWAAYVAGRYGGRPFLERYGRYVFLREHELAVAERWFARWGEVTAFFSRLLPGVRTFISLPAGIARMPLGRFTLYSALGVLPWTAALVWTGVKLGENWEALRAYFHYLDAVVVAAAFILLALAAVRRRRGRQRPAVELPPAAGDLPRDTTSR
ncbi:DedA family protein [Caldinitratiruptor microaerophilus]|uniref:Alkaline phosphatase n=1 Tax=Caldinitratiruptor microaerophilus TaxID=671077 RepID=A0AA35CHZ8_9FIRM|nr:DedA family protein [Caldinitratiruptor microaerophilus]BDG59267.1 alkaline phosphatase [Caldinitratiruptor microaerophilus]